MKKNGFTLVEVLAVISILGVVIVFVVPNLLSAFYKSRDILSDYEKNTIKLTTVIIRVNIYNILTHNLFFII